MKVLFFGSMVLYLLNSCEATSPGTPNPTSTTKQSKTHEFDKLWTEDQLNKDQKTAAVLNYLLNNPDPRDPKTAIVIENSSDCDLIMRLLNTDTSESYNLPVRRKSKNQFIISKGSYTLKSTICTAQYYSQKNIVEPLVLKLSQ